MNPVYSAVQPGAPYGNPKNVAYAGYPAGYPTAAPTYNLPVAGTLLTTPQHTALGAHPVSVPTYRAQGTPTYSYIPPHW
ncbi:protein FAM168A-like [Pseudonaja textilis]|uniref:protein FAM168A-like n=1 Tax=Pseudonaja textilis TaxID=8673 RepID=UPI000EA84A16|nr:protein FAM168A-like [Pseudonaja textilis]